MIKNQFNPDYRVPPSEIIRELAACFLKEHIKNIDLSIEQWEKLLSGELRINSRIAVELEKAFKISKDLWLNLQKNYDKK